MKRGIQLLAICMVVLSSACSKQKKDAGDFVGTWRDDSQSCPFFWTLNDGGSGYVYADDCNNGCAFFGGSNKAFEADLSWSNTSTRLIIDITGNEKLCGFSTPGAFTDNNQSHYNMLYTFSANRDTVTLVIDSQGNTNIYVRQ